MINKAISVIFVLCFSTFPDTYKSMLKGVIRALALQRTAVWINIVGHWCINMTLMYYFAFHLRLGLVGLWYSKLVLECYIFFAYMFIISKADWQKKIDESRERQN